MAPLSAGSFHVLVAKNLKVLRLAIKHTSKLIQNQVYASVRPASELQPAFARLAPRQPIHPAAFLKQSKRWFSNQAFKTIAREFSSGAKNIKYNRASFPKSRTGNAVNSSTGRAPFAHTLRPNLTGGTLGRTAGGYAAGGGRIGGARYFSHGPAAPAQVVQNVNQAIRAFMIGGKKAQFSGVNPYTGEKRYREVTELQSEASKKISAIPKATPGSYIDFAVNPTITALTPFGTVSGFQETEHPKMDHLNTEGLLDVLSIDFSRALKDLAMILSDLKKLSTLGDLPITYQNSCLRVHFPGCDADTVERLALELGLQRGIIKQDPDFDAYNGTEIALLFPYAPSKSPSECSFFEKPVMHRKVDKLWWDDPAVIQETPPSPVLGNLPTPDFSAMSDVGLELEGIPDDILSGNPWVSSPSGYETIRSSELDSPRLHGKERSGASTPLEYQGIEGIYHFMQQLDAAERRGLSA
ncbi:uncharacterized protein PV09_02513 [Verruconis gallopava]|uniref:Casein kinase II beta 2 subunit n=1 Tax=Verruconis gallopava TaxID=253628 RepID=A0A0D2AIU5_9PEZI|nr:uncharacterized protein PV09_02513 [Verruconis gallopava]KIW06833.1 hypothetical protein PV09_02513 [Verruconis gallopava]